MFFFFLLLLNWVESLQCILGKENVRVENRSPKLSLPPSALLGVCAQIPKESGTVSSGCHVAGTSSAGGSLPFSSSLHGTGAPEVEFHWVALMQVSANDSCCVYWVSVTQHTNMWTQGRDNTHGPKELCRSGCETAPVV